MQVNTAQVQSSTDSERLHCCCHLLNKVENIECILAILYSEPGMSSKIALSAGAFLAPTSCMVLCTHPSLYPKWQLNQSGCDQQRD